jgi:hypothetical protein
VIIDSYLALAEVSAALLRAPEVAEHWDEPSALAEFRVSGLAGHIAMAAVLRVAEWLEQPISDAEPVDAVGYFVNLSVPDRSPDHPISRRIRDASAEFAVDGPTALADRVDTTLAGLRTRLAELAPDQLVAARDLVLRLDQWLLTRMIELAVHIDDLAVSVGVPTPELPDEATDLVIITLARTARAYHGVLPVLRALSRRERATAPINAF